MLLLDLRIYSVWKVGLQRARVWYGVQQIVT